MSSSETKNDVETSNVDIGAAHHLLQGRARVYRAADALRILLTVLSLGCAAAVVGLSASALASYERSHLPAGFMLPLWPEGVDLRPTRAMIGGGAVVLITSAVSVVASKVEMIRKRAALHSAISLAAPLVSLIAAIAAVGLYYAAESSTTTHTLQSWSCRWRSSVMLVEPHFGTLCEQGDAAAVLAVLLIPLELLALAVAAYETLLERKLDRAWRQRALGGRSPTLS